MLHPYKTENIDDSKWPCLGLVPIVPNSVEPVPQEPRIRELQGDDDDVNVPCPSPV